MDPVAVFFNKFEYNTNNPFFQKNTQCFFSILGLLILAYRKVQGKQKIETQLFEKYEFVFVYKLIEK